MELTIVNADNVTITNKSEARLLWTAMLFADDINIASFNNFCLEFHYMFDKLTGKQKLELYLVFDSHR